MHKIRTKIDAGIKIIPQIVLLLLFYYLTIAIIFPEQHQGEGGGGGTQFVKEMRYSLLFVFLFSPILIRYVFNIFLSPWYPLARRIRLSATNRLPATYRPRVSIIIPAWNEEVGIVETIRSVVRNDYRAKEIIIINDGSTDKTGERIKQYLKKNRRKARFIYINKSNGGKASALNAGLKRTTGEIVITIDADSYMEKNAIKNLIKYFRDPELMSVAGNAKIGNSGSTINLLQTIEYVWGFYFKRADSLMNSIYIVGGAAAAYRREIFEKLGGFDENSITEDIEMSTRIQEANHKIGYAADVIVYTEGPASLKTLVKQRLRWKRGRFETFYKYSHLFFNLHRRNKYLTVFVLPLAMFMEFLLFIEPFLLIFLYYYIFTTGNINMLTLSLLILTSVMSFSVIVDGKGLKKYYLLLWAPVAWLVFYFIDFVEYQAQIKSLWGLMRKKEFKWQNWQRVGVFGK